MKKFFALATLLALISVQVGCAKSPAPSTAEIYAALKEQIAADLREVGFTDGDFAENELPSYFLTDLTGEGQDYVLPDLNKEDVQEGYVIKASMNINSNQVALIRAVPGKVEAVRAALELELASQRQLWDSYLPDQAEKVHNTIISAKGDFIIYITYPDPAAIEEVFNGFF